MTQSDLFFVGRTGKGVRIAIIDSGIHAEHPHVGGIASGIAISKDGKQHGDYVDRLGHGTAVAAAIREKAPEAKLFAIKVFYRSLTANVHTLVHALDWAARNRIRLVNLSLGTSNVEHEDLLRETVRRVGNHDVLIASACEDNGVRWLPGSLPDVVPVLLDWECPRNEYRVGQGPDGRTVFRASGYPREIPGVSPERNLKGISFAVANMTGFIARALEAHPDASFQDLCVLLCSPENTGTDTFFRP